MDIPFDKARKTLACPSCGSIGIINKDSAFNCRRYKCGAKLATGGRCNKSFSVEDMGKYLNVHSSSIGGTSKRQMIPSSQTSSSAIAQKSQEMKTMDEEEEYSFDEKMEEEEDDDDDDDEELESESELMSESHPEQSAVECSEDVHMEESSEKQGEVLEQEEIGGQQNDQMMALMQKVKELEKEKAQAEGRARVAEKRIKELEGILQSQEKEFGREIIQLRESCEGQIREMEKNMKQRMTTLWKQAGKVFSSSGSSTSKYGSSSQNVEKNVGGIQNVEKNVEKNVDGNQNVEKNVGGMQKEMNQSYAEVAQKIFRGSGSIPDDRREKACMALQKLAQLRREHATQRARAAAAALAPAPGSQADAKHKFRRIYCNGFPPMQLSVLRRDFLRPLGIILFKIVNLSWIGGTLEFTVHEDYAASLIKRLPEIGCRVAPEYDPTRPADKSANENLRKNALMAFTRRVQKIMKECNPGVSDYFKEWLEKVGGPVESTVGEAQGQAGPSGVADISDEQISKFVEEALGKGKGKVEVTSLSREELQALVEKSAGRILSSSVQALVQAAEERMEGWERIAPKKRKKPASPRNRSTSPRNRSTSPSSGVEAAPKKKVQTADGDGGMADALPSGEMETLPNSNNE